MQQLTPADMAGPPGAYSSGMTRSHTEDILLPTTRMYATGTLEQFA